MHSPHVSAAARVSQVFVPPRLTLAIEPRRFAAFLRAYGLDLPDALAAAPRLELARHLWGVSAPLGFAEAVDRLDLLASDTGFVGIEDAVLATGRALPTHLPAADLAAVLLTRRATDATLEPVVERALLRFARTVPSSPPLELAAREARRVTDPGACLAAVRACLGESRVVDCWYREDDRGSLHVAVVRRLHASAAITLDGAAVRRRVRRDLAIDTIRVDVPDGRIVVRSGDPRLERPYADAFGRALFGDASFFADTPSYTFKAIVAQGSSALSRARPKGISRVRIVEITWDDGEGTTFTAHGSDGLAAYEKREGEKGGYVTAALFRMDVASLDRAIDVRVCLPHRAEYRSSVHEPLARAALASLGVMDPGRVADDSYTMAPWIHSEWRLRHVLGDALFEQLRDAHLLVPAQTRMVGGAELGKYGWSYVSFDLKSEPGTKYAVAMDPALPSRDLDEAELRMWRLDLDAVKRALATQLGTEPAVAHAAIDGQALDLGITRGRGIDLRLFAVLRSPGKNGTALLDAMARAAGTAHVVVLLPEGRTLGGQMEVPLSMGELFGASGIASKVYGHVAERKGLPHGIIDGWKLAAPGVRYVVEDKTGRQWLDGHELDMRDTGAKVLHGTARGLGKPVRTGDLARFIAPNRTDDGVVRQTVPKLGGWIRASFEAAGVTPPEDADRIVEWVTGKGWKMTVKCEVR